MTMAMLAQEVKTRPIIFGSESVRAILEGRKTQTRRVVKPQSLFEGKDEIVRRFPNQQGCPYGKPGERLWVREALWVAHGGTVIHDSKSYAHPFTLGGELPDPRPCYFADDPEGERLSPDRWRKRSPMLMPRWSSRINLELTGVRVERVQVISETDAWAEGVTEGDIVWAGGSASLAFKDLWDSIDGKRHGCAWKDGPWVWVLSFRRLPDEASR